MSIKCPRLDSNQDYQLSRMVLCPLSDGGTKKERGLRSCHYRFPRPNPWVCITILLDGEYTLEYGCQGVFDIYLIFFFLANAKVSGRRFCLSAGVNG